LNENQGRATARIYSQAISALKAVFIKVKHNPTDDSHVAQEWIEGLPEGFMRLMGERQEIALVILGAYCVVLERLPQVWWLKGWSKGLFDVMWRGVEPAGKDTLEWPRKPIQTEV
jgi:hypothetical protein